MLLPVLAARAARGAGPARAIAAAAGAGVLLPLAWTALKVGAPSVPSVTDQVEPSATKAKVPPGPAPPPTATQAVAPSAIFSRVVEANRGSAAWLCPFTRACS